MITPSREYAEIFDYLSASKAPVEAYPVIIFGRKDARVAHSLVETAQRGLLGPAIITGGIGKDSGDIAEHGFDSEAAYLQSESEKHAKKFGFVMPSISLEKLARNGGENVRNSLAMFTAESISVASLTTIAHATSLRRLAAMAEHEKTRMSVDPTTYRIGTKYPFNSRNPADQAEARDELLRLVEWPKKDWLLPQDDLPENLVDFVLDQRAKQ